MSSYACSKPALSYMLGLALVLGREAFDGGLTQLLMASLMLVKPGLHHFFQGLMWS
jgi:hypothetical protein